MEKDPLLFVNHVLEEVAFLQTVARENDFAAFMRNPALPRASSYALQNISEAVRNIPTSWLDGVPGIAWAKIRGLGNVTRHEYFRVDPAIIWHTLVNDMSALDEAMRLLVQRHKKP